MLSPLGPTAKHHTVEQSQKVQPVSFPGSCNHAIPHLPVPRPLHMHALRDVRLANARPDPIISSLRTVLSGMNDESAFGQQDETRFCSRQFPAHSAFQAASSE